MRIAFVIVDEYVTLSSELALLHHFYYLITVKTVVIVCGTGYVLFGSNTVSVVLEVYRLAACYGTGELFAPFPCEGVALSVVVTEGITDSIVG